MSAKKTLFKFFKAKIFGKRGFRINVALIRKTSKVFQVYKDIKLY
jgi:hypothetical protein